ncbi:hypothetical protein PFISCL1PPCAC_15517, partial [Pristionchus fissidentatus]
LIYSSLSHQPIWTYLDVVAQSIRLKDAFDWNDKEDDRLPLLMMTLCETGWNTLSFDDSPYKVDTTHAGLVSMYENELRIVFKSFRSSLLFFSSAPQGDLLIAQCVQGKIEVIFDFGSLSPSTISGGRALDDGKWHELRWNHQFDSVQLYIDGVLVNTTSPTGLYRKLDLSSEMWIGGRPQDDSSLFLSLSIQSTFRGCLNRLQLNSIDLLSLAPSDIRSNCIMTSPPTLTLFTHSNATVPFSFLPFSFEFRLVSISSSFISLRNAMNDNLVSIDVVESSFVLTSNSTKHAQQSNPRINAVDGFWHSFSLKIRSSRLEIELDGITVLWLEGSEVRSISVNLASIVLSAEGCYRSVTLDLQAIPTEGKVERGNCAMTDRCTPNPCSNGGICIQSSLTSQYCQCPMGYDGLFCHISANPRSCEEFFYIKSLTGRKMSKKEKKVVIDVDGGESIEPMRVLCSIQPNDMGEERVITRVPHHMVDSLTVSGQKRAGELRIDLDYGINLRQMETLVDSFELCSQSMRFECKGGAKLMSWGDDRSPSSWYSTRSDKQGLQWGSAPPYSRMCPCALHSNCTSNKLCNCESGLDGIDEGNNTYSQLLPITSLFVGGTTISSNVTVSIGSLVCEHKLVYEPVTFMNRNGKLTGQLLSNGARFSLSFHVKFTYEQMSVFTWESLDSRHWFHLHVINGRMAGEISIGGELFEVKNQKRINDGMWHSIYWDAHRLSQRMLVDDDDEEENRKGKKELVLPNTLNWTIGSKTQRNNIGFAGIIRNVYLNGMGLPLGSIVREQNTMGIEEGEGGKCSNDRCSNGGRCIDHYDSYSCDCAITPFGGEDCTREHSIWVPLGCSLSIPWQNPSQTSLCHRLAVKTSSNNVTLVRSKSLFGDSSFNLSITTSGRLTVSIYDGLIFNKSETFGPINVSNEMIHDISICASFNAFKLTIDDQIAFNFPGNFTFFKSFNVWNLMDENFVGCLSRLQIGSSFPLKNPHSSRLKMKGGIKFGQCPSNIAELNPTPSLSSNSGINIGVSHLPNSSSLVSIAGVSSIVIVCLLLFTLCSLIVYMRSLPEGVYNTHESSSLPCDQTKCSPSRSEEPLVHQSLHKIEKEYFC